MAGTQLGHSMAPPVVGGLIRPRLIPEVGGTFSPRLGLVIGPPGSGKTTLLSHWSAQSRANAAWYRSSRRVAQPGCLLSCFAAALAAAIDDQPARSFSDMAVMAERLETPFYFVIDDLHLLTDTGADAELERLLTINSPQLHFLVGSRRAPVLNLARSELQFAITVHADDLRFRANEVDQLFRHTYRQPLSSAGALNLTERTDGWAAGLHLFHLATKSRSSVERRRAAESLSSASRFAQDYLAHHFLSGVSEDMKALLSRTCHFHVLTQSRCDSLLNSGDHRLVLRGLEQLGVISAEEDGAEFHVPRMLRQYFIASLNESEPELAEATRIRTASVLEQEGAYGDALQVLAEGQDWETVCSMLERVGPAAVKAGTCGWAAMLPTRLRSDDAMCALAASRMLLDDGRVADAYSVAVRVTQLTTNPLHLRCAAEIRAAASAWTDDAMDSTAGPSGSLRAATRGNPGTVARSLSSHGSARFALVRGLSLLLSGDQRAALPWLRRCAEQLDIEPAAALAAQLALAVFGPEMSTSDSDGPASEVDSVQRQASRRGLTWLARLARGVQAALPGTAASRAAVETIVESCELRGDEWGAALVAAAAAHLRLHQGRPDAAAFDALAVRFRRLGAGALEAWALSAQALVGATLDLPGAADYAQSAEGFARAAGVPGALAVAYAAMARQRSEHYSDLMKAAIESGSSAGLVCRPWTWLANEALLPKAQRANDVGRDAGQAQGAKRMTYDPSNEETEWALRSGLQVGCFGGFSLRLDGVDVDLSKVRPQARTVIRILAMNAGRPVHRERLAGILWADLDTSSALHNLQVSVSSLRRALHPDGPVGGQQLLVRHGEAYSLVLTAGSTFDLADFDNAVRDASFARSSGDHFRATTELQLALELYSGEVLPEDGPAEWVTETRERYRLRAAEAALSLAGLQLALGNFAEAAAAASRGVEIDPWRDESWRILVEIFRRSGDPAAAEYAQRRYRRILNSLGVPG